jgi:hypothetical protein
MDSVEFNNPGCAVHNSKINGYITISLLCAFFRCIFVWITMATKEEENKITDLICT